jgi:hypothetical protein
MKVITFFERLEDLRAQLALVRDEANELAKAAGIDSDFGRQLNEVPDLLNEAADYLTPMRHHVDEEVRVPATAN